MRDDLLGYLLDALEPEERVEVEARLRQDASLQRDLETLRKSLVPLAVAAGDYDPPDGLAEATCQRVAEQSAAVTLAPKAAVAPARFSFSEMAIAAGILIAAAMLVLPAINNSRAIARLETCAERLSQLGRASHQYSNLFGNYFPDAPPQKGASLMSMVGPKLANLRLVDNAETFVCPERALEIKSARPSLEELAHAGPEVWTGPYGTSYGYSMGHEQDNQYHPPRNQSRSRYALMADAPGQTLDKLESANHGSLGWNVLFEDGRVEVMTKCELPDCKDNIFTNSEGRIAPGTHPDDSVIGVAWD